MFESQKLNKKNFIYHAGTKIRAGKIVSIGGRVLNVVSIGKSYFVIREQILKMLKKINWKYGFFRKDIGWRVL